MAWFGKRDGDPDSDARDPGASVDGAGEEAAAEDPATEDSATEDAAAVDPAAVDSGAVGSTPTPAVSASVVFLPEPEGEDQGDDPGTARATETAPALEWTIKARPLRPEPLPRTALQEKMAEIAEKHKDGPIEDMTGPIRDALAADGREVPGDWILAIAEGLRQHGPISLNLGGPGRVPS